MTGAVAVDDELEMHVSDGAELRIDGTAGSASIEATRGGLAHGGLEVSGPLTARAEHGARISLDGHSDSLSGFYRHGGFADLSGLQARRGHVEAHHGATAEVTTTEELEARATHGATITVTTRPPVFSSSEENGGSVTFARDND
jgi:hypothetical protein